MNSFKLKKLSFLLLIILIITGCKSEVKEKKQITDVILNDSESFFYVDTSTYPKNREQLPIGVFDSGTGGLTVLDAIVNFDKYNNADRTFNANGDKKNDFEKENFIYLGDQANMPYGNYSKENKVDLLKEHIIKDVQFLLSNKYYNSADEEAYNTDRAYK